MHLPLALEQRTKVEEFTRKHHIGLLMLLFTDVVGSLRLKEELGEAQGIALLQWHRLVVREILGSFHQAEEIETAGDSFFIVFAKPSDVIHRDVKPSNILIADRGVRTAESENHKSEFLNHKLTAKLTDFGIGQLVSEEALAGLTKLGFTQTMSGASAQTGTQMYMAPEVIAGRPATIRSDIYSLGVVLCQLLARDLSPAKGPSINNIYNYSSHRG